MNKNRIAAFSSLLHFWPMVFVYISSFLQILIIWVGHHDLFNSIDAISYKLFVYNGLWLLTQTFVPLGTKG
ncbi:TMEM175 family protein [Streptococcus sp. H31]|uniref:TMEM175 family protein n=1 Tax=Streptococcus huangxiaojuni TaxID=3237239 RepID=UPI0034A4EA6C